MFSRAPKYSRSLNWSPDEKRELLNLVDRYKSFIENKDCDSLSHRRRSEAWSTVATHFANSFPPGREPQKMKEQYQRMKSLARKMLTHQATVIIQGGYQEGDEAREALAKLPKWIDRIITIVPRDFEEYCRIIKPSDFSESDYFVGQETSDVFEVDTDSRSQLSLSSFDNQNDEAVVVADDEQPHIKVEDDDQQDAQVKRNRLLGAEDHIIDENDTASVISNSNVDNIAEKPPQEFNFSRRFLNPSSSRKRKAYDQPQLTLETCSDRIQWEEHVQKMRHRDEEHSMKMEIMSLHKQILQQHVQCAVQDPRSAQNLLSSSAQMFDNLSKLSHRSRDFIPLS